MRGPYSKWSDPADLKVEERQGAVTGFLRLPPPRNVLVWTPLYFALEPR